MNFVKMLVELPILIIILIFAFVNNDFVSFSLWPFFIELTVSQSVVIVVLILFGFLMGKLDSYISYAPLRKALRQQRKANRRLNKEHQRLSEKVSNLEDNLVSLKEENKTVKENEPKLSLGEKVKNLFHSKKNDA